MSNFSFGKINTASRKQVLNLKLEKEALLRESHGDRNLGFTPIILVDELYEDVALQGIERFLKMTGLLNYKILSAINCNLDPVVIKKQGKIAFYKKNKSDFWKYIEPGVPIITIGPALYTLLQEDDIYPSHCQQIIFGKSYFWFSPDLTEENCHRIFPVESFRDIFARGFKNPVDSFKTKLAKLQIDLCMRIGGDPVPKYPQLNKIFIHNKEEFHEEFYLKNKDRHDEVLAWDIETSGFSFLKDRIGCITLSFDGITGYYIPWKAVNKRELGEIFKNNRQLGANLKFDCKFLWANGVKTAKIDEDVLTLAHTLDETRANSLKAMAFFYSEFGGYERPLDLVKDKLGKGRDVSYIDDIPEEVLWDYAVMDAIVTRRVWDNMMKHAKELDKRYPNELSSRGLIDYYYTRRIPAENMYAEIEFKGCYVDKAKLDNLRKEMSEVLAGIKKELADAFNVSVDFEWTSNPKLGKLLERSGWEELGRSKAGEYLVGDFQLSRWVKTYPIARKIVEMKSMNTLLNTFVGDPTSNSLIAEFLDENDEEGSKGWTKYLTYHPEDDSWRLHPNFKPMRTDSGRSISTQPNMQQVPSHSKWATRIKQCIVTPDDDNYLLVTVDYSSLQMRLACIDQREEDFLREVLRRPNVDIHSATGWATLAKGRLFDIKTVTVTFEDNSTATYLGGQEVFTANRGNVLGEKLTTEDIIKDLRIKDISIVSEHREITEDEFRKQKTVEPYATMRQAAKGENFLMIFGGSPKVLSDQALETTWDEEQCDEYIEINHCEKELEQAKKMYKGESEAKLKNIAVCMRLRQNFFKGYPGLWNRIGREKEFAASHGYVRTVFGKVRNVIELFLRGEFDNENMSGILKSLENICANHPAQNMEACIRGRAQYDTIQWLKNSKRKSRSWNEIHDSADFWIEKTELHDVLSHIKHVFERIIPELEEDWVPLIVDCEVSDLKQGDYYKGGRDPIEWGINWSTCKYEDPYPFEVELSPELEKKYFREREEYWNNKGEKDPQEKEIRKYLKETYDVEYTA